MNDVDALAVRSSGDRVPIGLAQVWRGTADTQPTGPALIHDGTVISWQALARRIDSVAAVLHEAGIRNGDVVAITLGNRPEHLITLAGCLLAGAAPICVDPWELFCRTLDSLSPGAIVFDAVYADDLAPVQAASPASRVWLCADLDAPSWSVPWPTSETALGRGAEDVAPEGTTLFRLSHGDPPGHGTIYRWNAGDFAQHLARRPPWWPLHAAVQPEGGGERLLVADRLLDGGIQNRALETLCGGGTVITTSRSPRELWDVAAESGATSMAVTGSQLESLHLEALAARQDVADLQRLRTILTCGSLCPPSSKEQLLQRLPAARVVDVFDTAEGVRLAYSIATTAHIPPSGVFRLTEHARVVGPDAKPVRPWAEGRLATVPPYPVGIGTAGSLPAHRLIDGGGEIWLSAGETVRGTESGEIVLKAVPPSAPAVSDLPAAEAIFTTLVAHPHVLEAGVVELPHAALGSVFGVLVVLDQDGTVADVTASAHNALPEHLQPRLILRVPKLPTTYDGKFSISRARSMLRDAASLERPDTVRRPLQSNRDRVWGHLVRLAEDEQVLLTEVLGALMATPDLERRVAKVLGYPDWPMPLTLLPQLDPQLAKAHPDLDSYLTFWETAATDVLVAVDHYGWPYTDRDGPHVSDAVWLLLQHCDLHNDAREDVLFTVTQAVALGRADPRHLALLQDRTRSLTKEEQLFGTFMLRRDSAPHFLYPAPPQAELDRMRARIGLPSVASDLSRSDVPLVPCDTLRRRTGAAPRVPELESPSAHAWRVLPSGSAPVYLCGPAELRQELRELRAALPQPLLSTARWLDRSPGLCAASQFDAGPAADKALARARLDDIRQSRLMIVLEDDRTDALTRAEAGAALATGVPVIRVGESGDPLDDYPAVTAVPDAAAALEAAREWASR
ncbi:AMP-binding protein [Streptomyces sp. NPDC004237]|uniref:AMP-binding protein n=1 Tax=Streptomyces sp. NPDC004237 TaxID=3154455 RepID=UPI0033ADE0CA